MYVKTMCYLDTVGIFKLLAVCVVLVDSPLTSHCTASTKHYDDANERTLCLFFGRSTPYLIVSLAVLITIGTMCYANGHCGNPMLWTT